MSVKRNVTVPVGSSVSSRLRSHRSYAQTNEATTCPAAGALGGTLRTVRKWVSVAAPPGSALPRRIHKKSRPCRDRRARDRGLGDSRLRELGGGGALGEFRDGGRTEELLVHAPRRRCPPLHGWPRSLW